MKIIYSNNTTITTVVLDMRDVLINKKFTPEIALEDLYKYVQIIDLSKVVNKDLLLSHGADKIIKMILNGGIDGDLKFRDEYYDEVLMLKWKEYLQRLAYDFEIEDENYFIKLISDSKALEGIKCIPVDKPKGFYDLIRDREKANRGEIVDEINVDIPLWKNSKQLITVFKNPDNDNNLRYAYAGIAPNGDKDYKKSYDNELEDDYSL